MNRRNKIEVMDGLTASIIAIKKISIALAIALLAIAINNN